MYLSENLYESGLIEEITRITGATISVYSNKARIARLNHALDKYWQLASDAAPKGTFDDTNNTSLPVETQNLVAGTNAYKLTAFSSEVLQLLKVTILADNADEREMIHEEFDDLEQFTKLYSTASADRGEPVFWTKMGDYIYLRPCPSYSETNGLRAYINRELSKFVFTTFTVTIASPGVFSATGHGLVANDAVILETDGALPTGLTADTTLYYVISTGLTADAFQVSTTIGGSAVNTSGSQSGNHKFTKATKEPGIPVIHHPYLARHASMPFVRDKKLPNYGELKREIGSTDPRSPFYGGDEVAIQDYWAHRDRELKTVIKTAKRAFR